MLKDILLSSSSNLSMTDLEDNFGDYKLYGATGFIKCIDFFDKDEEYIAIVKDGAGVGKSFLCDLKSSILSTLQYLTPKNKNNLKFSYYLLYNIHFEKYKVGSTIPHIYYKDYSKEKVFIPSIEEQRKIANFLVNIDKKINLLNQKQKLLRNFKKFCLQNIFSEDEKLRFKNLQVEDNSDWKKFILKDILLSSSSNLSMADLEDNFGDYKLYGATGFIKCIDFFDQKEGYMAIVKDGAGVGKTFLCDPKSSVLSTLLYLTPKKDYNLKFCYYLLKTLHFGKYKVGSTIPHIYYKDFSKEKVFIPSVEEQEKIARFLTAIDKKIDFTQNQITEMEKFKKGLLQQMFVYLIFYTSIFLILIFFKIILNNKCIILYFIGSFY